MEGETIVIDLLTGAYHTLEGASADAWLGLTGAEAITVDARRLTVLSTLVAAGLVVATDPDSLPPPAEAETVGLTSYFDMAELLLADPVHDVDERGWPILRRP